MFAHELIRDITSAGSVSVADYMARCNAHYYATRDPFGYGGDFITAPEISQIFGELVGAWCAQAWQECGGQPMQLCELGPGRGTLMKDILRATSNVAGFREALDITMVETSPALRAKQQEALSGVHPRIEWQDDLKSLRQAPLLLIANEFFDALPVRQYVRTMLQEKERRIACKDKQLVFTPGGEVAREDSPESVKIMSAIAGHIRTYGGAALIIDYGYVNGETGDTLQALKRHQFVSALEFPGEADLTAHVDFAALATAAQNCGAQVHGPVEQGLFLKRLGAELRATALCKKARPDQHASILSGLERLVAPQEMGELFKVMAVTSTLESPAGF